MGSPIQILSAIQEKLTLLGTEATRASVSKFVPGSQKVYGLKMPLLNELAKQFRQEGFPLVYALWESGAFEEKILAAKLINTIAKKNAEEAFIAVEKFSHNISDWAVCDTIGMQSLKPIAGSHKTQVVALAKKLNRSKNLWQRRLSLVLVEVYAKEPEMHPVINSLIKTLANDNEYYVKKAIVWLKSSMNKKRMNK